MKKLNNEDNQVSRKPRRRNLPYDKYLFGKSFKNFEGGIDNDSTREDYTYNLFCMCERLNLTTEQLYEKYSEEEITERRDCKPLENQLRDVILEFKKTLKEYDPHASTIHMYISAFQNFCESNRISPNFKWVRRWLPKKPDKGNDKKYTHEQILLMLNKGAVDARSKLITLLFSSSGIREGALCKLEHQDINPRYNEDGILEGASV
ncbi:MAG TPA: hypothetical protein VF884_13815, partial [Nitrososphaeraceae archaeon]